MGYNDYELQGQEEFYDQMNQQEHEVKTQNDALRERYKKANIIIEKYAKENDRLIDEVKREIEDMVDPYNVLLPIHSLTDYCIYVENNLNK